MPGFWDANEIPSMNEPRTGIHQAPEAEGVQSFRGFGRLMQRPFLTGGRVITRSGWTRMVTAVADTYEWQPRYGSCQRFLSITGDSSLHADTLGYFYAPLILLDQKFIHRSIPIFSDNGSFIEPSLAPPLAGFHAIPKP